MLLANIGLNLAFLARLLFTARPTARPLAGNPLRDVFAQDIRPNPR